MQFSGDGKDHTTVDVNGKSITTPSGSDIEIRGNGIYVDDVLVLNIDSSRNVGDAQINVNIHGDVGNITLGSGTVYAHGRVDSIENMWGNTYAQNNVSYVKNTHGSIIIGKDVRDAQNVHGDIIATGRVLHDEHVHGSSHTMIRTQGIKNHIQRMLESF